MVSGRFKHDCDACKLIGIFYEQDEKDSVDYYYHEYDDHVTLIRRFSSEPSDNASRPLWPGDSIGPNSCSYGIYNAYLNWVVHNKEEEYEDDLCKQDR
jgi:hypothetical protein